MSITEMHQIGVDIAYLSRKTRKREVVRPRKAACFKLWKHGLTQETIANLLCISQPAVSWHISHPNTYTNDF
jgi:DNA-binding CsgD family transcriptional regulator